MSYSGHRYYLLFLDDFINFYGLSLFLIYLKFPLFLLICIPIFILNLNVVLNLYNVIVVKNLIIFLCVVFVFQMALIFIFHTHVPHPEMAKLNAKSAL